MTKVLKLTNSCAKTIPFSLELKLFLMKAFFREVIMTKINQYVHQVLTIVGNKKKIQIVDKKTIQPNRTRSKNPNQIISKIRKHLMKRSIFHLTKMMFQSRNQLILI